MCFINSISRGSTRFQAAGGKGEFRGRLDKEAIYSCNKGARLRRRQGALRLLRPHARLQQLRVAHMGTF